MKRSRILVFTLTFILVTATHFTAFSQKKGLKQIDRKDLYTHLSFIASDDMKGRNTPSKELKIAAQYLASHGASYGLKPLTPGGSFYQNIPLEITTISESGTDLIIVTESGRKTFRFPADFGMSSNSSANVSGEIVFVGGGISAPDLGWDDYEGVDVEGKFVLHLDGDLPETHPINKPENRMMLYNSYRAPRQKGAIGTITIHDERREKDYREKNLDFDNPERGAVIWDEEEYKQRLLEAEDSIPERPYLNVTIRHSVAAELLGVSENELLRMFDMIGNGQQVQGKKLDMTVDLNVEIERKRGHTRNVVAYIEGKDEKLKDEYILIGSHYDHVGERRGEIYNGADDDGSGTVAMLEIAQALSVEKPDRSVILVWHTGEEKGLWGANWFVENCPVPLEKISGMLQMDMISRNAPDSIYVIGSHFLSSELDEISDKTADKQDLIYQSDFYNDPNKRRNFHRNSDHFAYHRAGIPAIFYFCGVHEDLHSPTDTIEKCNFDKMERVTRLVYATCIALGNTKEILKLDNDPKVTLRGKHNISQTRRRR